MRFLVQPSPDALARARPPVRAFLLFAALALVGLAAQRVANGGLSAGGVTAFYLPGGDPLPAAALWEEIHAGAFLYGFVLLMLGSLLAVCPVPARLRSPLFAAAVVALRGGGALRVATSVAALASLAVLLALVAGSWGRAGRRAR